MCLLTNWTEPKVAVGNIKVYKVLLDYSEWRLSGAKFPWSTPYQGYNVKPRMNMFSSLKLEERALWHENIHIAPMMVEVGIHAFRNLASAKVEWATWTSHVAIIVECTIPKGAKYVEGAFQVGGVHVDSVASDTMRIGDRVVRSNRGG